MPGRLTSAADVFIISSFFFKIYLWHWAERGVCVCVWVRAKTPILFFFFLHLEQTHIQWGPGDPIQEILSTFFSCILVNFYVLCHAFLIYGLFLGDIVILDILTSTQKHFVATILVLSQNIPLIKMKGSDVHCIICCEQNGVKKKKSQWKPNSLTHWGLDSKSHQKSKWKIEITGWSNVCECHHGNS